jgi:hypothetical protein
MYWNTNCRDIKGWPILSEIRAGTVPGDGEVQRENQGRKDDGFAGQSLLQLFLGMSAFRGLYLLFRSLEGAPQTGEIRLNIDVDVAVPFQHPVWGGISGHFSLSSPDREAYEEQEYGQHCSSEKRNSLSH